MYLTTAGMLVGPTLNEHRQRETESALNSEGDFVRSLRAYFKEARAMQPLIPLEEIGRDPITFHHEPDLRKEGDIVVQLAKTVSAHIIFKQV